MPNKTGIEWTDYSTNPLRARLKSTGKTGHYCEKISAGCANCYSSRLQPRFGLPPFGGGQHSDQVEHFLDQPELRRILTFRPRGPFQGGSSRPRVFPFDMTDVFGDWVDLDDICTLFGAFALRPDVDFQVLTKRPQRMAEIFNTVNIRDLLYDGMERAADIGGIADFLYDDVWPLPNVWLGTSVENQEQADKRIPQLLGCPAAVRFLSCEPLLGAVDWVSPCGTIENAVRNKLGMIDWVIVGGESGHGARPCHVEWVRSIISRCQTAGVPCFVKQLGGKPIFDDYNASVEWPQGVYFDSPEDNEPDGPNVAILNDKKGGNWNEWPNDLRVREFPEVTHA